MPSISHLTGTQKITKNHFNYDEGIWRERRTVRQMFFQPYESKQEFISCARHTFLPMAVVGMALLTPEIIVTVPIIIGGVSIVFAALGGLNSLWGNERGASIFFEMASYLIRDLFQMLTDIILLPLSVLVMITRGISTGLQAAGIHGVSPLTEEASSSEKAPSPETSSSEKVPSPEASSSEKAPSPEASSSEKAPSPEASSSEKASSLEEDLISRGNML